MLESVGVACITIAVILELASYYKQIAKTLRTKKSAQVSSSAFLLKIIKYLFTLAGLGIFANWVGFGIEVAALIFCCIALYIIARFKPKGWTLFNRSKKLSKKKKGEKHEHKIRNRRRKRGRNSGKSITQIQQKVHSYRSKGHLFRFQRQPKIKMEG